MRASAPAVTVHVSLDLGRIRAQFAAEQPPVEEAHWDAEAYLAERRAALGDAVGAVLPHCTVTVNGDATEGDAVTVEHAGDETLRETVMAAVEPVLRDAQAWRRGLRFSYFDHYRNWRKRVGSPIAH